jgi:Zn-dependent membrane protease YugP
MSSWGLYFIFLIPPLIIGFVVQHWLKKTVAANMQVEITNGLTGAEVARQILDRNGLQNVPVETSPGGPLSDHYDPRNKSVHLSSTRRPTHRSSSARRCGRPSRSRRTPGSSSC